MRMPKSGEAKMKMDERLATSVCKASRRVTQLYDNTLAPCGLRSAQYSILAQLATRSEVPTGTKLAEAMVSHRSSLGHAFRPLDWDGYVVLRRGETDRRTQRVALTDWGDDEFRKALTYWQTTEGTFVSWHGDKCSKSLRAAVLMIAHDEGLGKVAEDAAS
jgi:DNA-binding MarR family transcriptional regulator